MSYPTAPHTTAQTRAFLKGLADSGSTAWYEQCLSSERQARGLPGGVASAKVAAGMIPAQYRVSELAKIKPGMIMFFGAKSSTYGHIVFVNAIRTNSGVASSLNDIEVYSNDVVGRGRIGLCRASYFPAHWGQEFDHAAMWLNGYVFPEAEGWLGVKARPAVKVKTRGGLVDLALDSVTAAETVAKKAKATKKAQQLEAAREALASIGQVTAPKPSVNLKPVKVAKTRGVNVDTAIIAINQAVKNNAKRPAKVKKLQAAKAALMKVAPL